jgi:hypothetical protein
VAEGLLPAVVGKRAERASMEEAAAGYMGSAHGRSREVYEQAARVYMARWRAVFGGVLGASKKIHQETVARPWIH